MNTDTGEIVNLEELRKRPVDEQKDFVPVPDSVAEVDESLRRAFLEAFKRTEAKCGAFGDTEAERGMSYGRRFEAFMRKAADNA